MKKSHRKALVLLVCTVLLMAVGVSGTVAFLADNTDSLTNTFTPVVVDTKINETVAAGSKSSIKVYNNPGDNHIDAYVRVAVYGNWVDTSGKIVAPWNGPVSLNTASWEKVGDFYYYKSVLAVGKETENLLSYPISEGTKPNGADHLVVTVVHQAIQAEPASAVTAAWDWTPPAASN